VGTLHQKQGLSWNSSIYRPWSFICGGTVPFFQAIAGDPNPSCVARAGSSAGRLAPADVKTLGFVASAKRKVILHALYEL